MAADIHFAPETEQDLDEAYAWYEERRVGLGEEFISCVDACIQAIARMPQIHARVHREYRRMLVRRFPYAVIYEHHGNAVTVYCIFHTSRSPESWKRRLP